MTSLNLKKLTSFPFVTFRHTALDPPFKYDVTNVYLSYSAACSAVYGDEFQRI